MTSALKICPVCSTEYPANERFCPRDGSALRAQGGSSTDLVGSIIAERYHVIKKLGEGGMGQVYLAEHVKMGRKSAVKVMHQGMVENVDAISRFNREAANASRINHPNVAGIYDFGETAEGLIYLAMEFVEGQPLTDVIRANGHLPPMRATEIARQTAEGLSVAHDMGIVHRDLKPDNIMIGKGRGGADQVKVVDFGIAKAAASDNQKVTKTGMVVGTPEYMSPEQLSGDPLDARSDIYSLGLVTFAMFTGKLPFPSDSAQETMIMRLTDLPKRLGDMKPDVQWPDDVQAVMDKVLARDVNLRYRSAAEYARDLVEAVDRMPATSITTIKTHLVSSMTPADAAAAATAATVVSVVPPTRVGTKGEMAGRGAGGAVAGNQETAAAVGQGGGKSKVMMFGGVGIVIAAAVIALVVMQSKDKTGGKEPNSRPPAVTPSGDSTANTLKDPQAGSASSTQTASPPGGNSAPTIDAQLYTIANRLDEGATVATYNEVLQEVGALKPKIKLLDDSVNADLIRARAKLGLADKPGACSIVAGIEPRARREKDKLAITSVKTEAGCSPSE